MYEYIKLFFTFFSGFVAGFLSHWFTVHREREARRHKFRIGMRKRLIELGATEVGKLVEWHHRSIPLMQDECVAIMEDIANARRADFNRALNGYCKLTAAEIEQCNAEYFMALAHAEPTKPGARFFDLEKGRAITAGFLNALIEAAR